MDDSKIHSISGGASMDGAAGGGGGLGNRVNAVVMSTVLASQEVAIKQLLTSLGIGRQINVTI